MQFKSSVEKDKLLTLKLECSGARTEDERQIKWLLKLVLTNVSQEKLYIRWTRGILFGCKMVTLYCLLLEDVKA